ncbi:DUF817 domain-containing protein [Pseudalkalibacillus sp. SCS-8]|uniref:DUF817 domain-containing protein n=1 Tax=Pseudalkalibacillus nanhaiensis TaxID=3115291 RepID=UPI0032DB2572
MSCIFPLIIFTSLFLTDQLKAYIAIPRYDMLLLICVTTQILMLVTRFESIDELKVICVFHLIGILLELFKVNMGSWSYPEEAYSKLYGVPLYSGFMYASVASYLCQAWRRLDVEIKEWPNSIMTIVLGAAIYLNFFTHHYTVDIRWWLIALLFILFFRTRVLFRVRGHLYQMPITLAYFLIGFFVWVAENIATFFKAWHYPYQQEAWLIVDLGKLSSWFLLVIVSFLIVAQLKMLKQEKG